MGDPNPTKTLDGRKLLIEQGLDSTIHGISNIIKSNVSIAKLLWLICFLAATLACCVFIGKALDDYFDYNVVTTISLIRENEINFPTITFCFNDGSDYDLRTILIKCSYNNIQCSPDEFEKKKIRSIFGVAIYCHIYNNGMNSSGHNVEIKTSNHINHLEGLKLGFYLQNSRERIFYHVGDPKEVHAYNDIMHNIGYRTKRFLFIEKLVEHKLETPYNPCDSEQTIKESLDPQIKNKMVNDAYKQSYCLDICLEIYIENVCNCSLINRNFENETICYACFKKEHSTFDYTKRCKAACPLQCSMTYYYIQKEAMSDEEYRFNEIEMSAIREWLRLMKNITNISDDGIVRRVAYMNFKFLDLKYTKITQIPKMIASDIVSNVGGNFKDFSIRFALKL